MLASPLIIFACGSALDMDKRPSGLWLGFELVNTSHPQLRFSKGFISVDKFQFTGDRENADDVYFTRDYPGGITSAMSSPALTITSVDNYDVPEGVYNHIALRLELYATDNSNTTKMAGLWVEGTLTKSDNTMVPIRVEIAADVALDITATSASGSIITLKNATEIVDVQFTPVDWFDGISMSALENAPLTDVNGTMKLVISKEANADLYGILLTNVEGDTKAMFK